MSVQDCIKLTLPGREAALEAYPEVGSLPTDGIMSPCEVLCWIGYRRAIDKATYYAPLELCKGGKTDDLASLLHATIPGPKPDRCPMEIAERELMKAWRGDRICPRRTDTREKLPPEMAEYDVVISARGGLEPDGGVSIKAWNLAKDDAESAYVGPIHFMTDDVLRIWPASLRISERSRVDEAGTTMTAPPSPMIPPIRVKRNRTGPKPVKTTETTRQMICDHRHDPRRLAEEKQFTLQHTYQVSRETAVKARNAALAELQQNSDKTPNSDK